MNVHSEFKNPNGNWSLFVWKQIKLFWISCHCNTQEVDPLCDINPRWSPHCDTCACTPGQVCAPIAGFWLLAQVSNISLLQPKMSGDPLRVMVQALHWIVCFLSDLTFGGGNLCLVASAIWQKSMFLDGNARSKQRSQISSFVVIPAWNGVIRFQWLPKDPHFQEVFHAVFNIQ